jgi:hypothetical protein
MPAGGGVADARHMNNVLNPEELDLNRSRRMSQRQRAALAREAKGCAVAAVLPAALLAWHVRFGPGLNLFAALIALATVLAAARFAKLSAAALSGRVAEIDGQVGKRIERDDESTSHWLLVGKTRFPVSADEFWRLPEGGPYRVWFSPLAKTVLNAAPLPGWEESPNPECQTWSQVLSPTPAEEPRPPDGFDLKQEASGAWVLGVGVRQWRFRSGELLTRSALAWDASWVRLANPRLRVTEQRVADAVEATLSVASATGTHSIASKAVAAPAGEGTPPLRLGRFMAARTGLPLEVTSAREPARDRKPGWTISFGGGD